MTIYFYSKSNFPVLSRKLSVTTMSSQHAKFALLTALACTSAAKAHHSIAHFDGSRQVSITGAVQEFRWVNPHVVFVVETATGERWSVELSPPNVLVDAGWTRTTLAIGDRLTVTANPLRASDTTNHKRLLYVGLVLPSGKSLGQPAR
jgi:Family of unknown function (DUF6152)